MSSAAFPIPSTLRDYLLKYENANLNDTSPAAPSSNANVTWQVDEFGNISAYVPAGGGGGTTFGPADYGVTQANTFTFPATGDFDVNTANVNLSAITAAVNLSSATATNIDAATTLNLQSTGAMLIESEGLITIQGDASGGAAIEITSTSAGSISIDSSSTLELSGTSIVANAPIVVSAGNATGLVIKEGNAQSGALVQFENHTGGFLSGINKTGDFVFSSTSGAPVDTPTTCSARFDPTASKLWIYNGTAWVGIVLS